MEELFIGMEKEYLPKIFDAFTQEESTRKNKYGSTGLGMAITREIIESKHGGTVTFDSKLGVGTVFTFTIPVKTK